MGFLSAFGSVIAGLPSSEDDLTIIDYSWEATGAYARGGVTLAYPMDPAVMPVPLTSVGTSTVGSLFAVEGDDATIVGGTGFLDFLLGPINGILAGLLEPIFDTIVFTVSVISPALGATLEDRFEDILNDLRGIEDPVDPPDPPPDPDGAFVQIIENGFGDPDQLYTWSMLAFNDLLFVGTAHRDAFSIISIPDDGAGLILAYDPIAEVWTEVTDDGLGDTDNNGFRTFAEYDGELYAASFNRTTGVEIWRSADGFDWVQTNEDGFGDARADAARGMISFNGHLYAGVQKNEALGGEVWRYDGEVWVEVLQFAAGTNSSAHGFEIFNEQLYVVTRNFQGAEVLRSDDGLVWETVVGPGAGTASGFGDGGNTAILDIEEFNGFLYAGTLNLETGGELWRSADGVNWQQIGTDGFGDSEAIYIWQLEVHNGELYIGVANRGDGDGAELWRTSDGVTLEELVGPTGSLAEEGFGTPELWGTRTLESMDVAGEDVLFVGAADFPFDDAPEVGGTVFRFDEDAVAASSQDADLLVF